MIRSFFVSHSKELHTTILYQEKFFLDLKCY